jgi:hypothetical protein
MAFSGVRISWLTRVAFGVRCLLGGTPGGDEFLLGPLPLRHVAQHRAIAIGALQPADRHKQGNEPAPRFPADDFASVIHDACHAARCHPGDILINHALAFGGEQKAERFACDFRRIKAEQRFRGLI